VEKMKSKKKYQKEYFRLTITYIDGEFSGRVFGDREKAEKHAAKQKKSPVVKKANIEAFTRERNAWRKPPANRDKKSTSK
jgi:hypothetical protein